MKWSGLKAALVDIEKRPGMFFGEKSIFALRNFFAGYDFATSIHSVEESELFDNRLSFHDWIALRTQFYESTSGWANMLNDFYGSDELALDMFYVHYREYLNRVGVVEKYVDIHVRQKWKTRSVDRQVVFHYLTPHRVEVVKYTDDPGRFVRFLDSRHEQIEQERYVLNEGALKFQMMGIPFSSSDWVLC